jgi:hypothetical protein
MIKQEHNSEDVTTNPSTIRRNKLIYTLYIVILSIIIIFPGMTLWQIHKPPSVSNPDILTHETEDIPVLWESIFCETVSWEPISLPIISRANSMDYDICEPPTVTPTPTPISTEDIDSTCAVTASEYDLFCRIIALEGHPKYGYDNYLQIATVILNRVASDLFPDTIIEVLSQKNQFSTYNSTRIPVYNDFVYRAADDALSGKRNLPDYIIAFITISAYKTNVSNGGWFARASVYEINHNSVWCYLP